MRKIYFIIGGQNLYGDETLRQAEKDGGAYPGVGAKRALIIKKS